VNLFFSSWKKLLTIILDAEGSQREGGGWDVIWTSLLSGELPNLVMEKIKDSAVGTNLGVLGKLLLGKQQCGAPRKSQVLGAGTGR